MDWTVEAIDQLRSLWAEGHSTAEIGRRMGVTKNAVVGKAHRLSLPARPSPIRRDAEEGGGAPRPARVRRAAPTPRHAPPFRQFGPPAAPPAAGTAAPTPTPAAADVQATAPAPAAAVVRPFPRASGRSCCWPLGEPGTPEFRFCAGEALAGKPYCAEHAAVAYVKARDRREDAA